MSFFYRKEMLEKVGVAEPKSFAELEAASEKLKAAGITPFSLGGKFSWMTMRFTDFFIEHIAGPKLHDDLMNMRIMGSGCRRQGICETEGNGRTRVISIGFLNVDPATNM
jgi:raffinose/stachyose/melibiose transport system substrate-binding protein